MTIGRVLGPFHGRSMMAKRADDHRDDAHRSPIVVMGATSP
jgi:hypothetical protein